MKKYLGLGFVLILLLTSCSTKASTTPSNVVTVTDLFGAEADDLKYPSGVAFEFVRYNGDDVDVMIDGKPYTLNDPNNNTYIALASKDKYGQIEFWYTAKLLDKFTWENNVDGEMIAFGDTNEVAQIGERENDSVLVLFDKEDAPEDVIDPSAWDGTYATLCSLEYPSYYRFVQNLDTGEIAEVGGWLMTIDEHYRLDGVNGGQCVNGYVKVSDWDVYVTSSKPDDAKMNIAFNKAEEIYGVGNVSTPAQACLSLSGYSVMQENSISKEQLEDWCGLYSYQAQ